MIFNPAGGLRYHMRAAAYSRQHWEAFRTALGVWLQRWDPPEKNLIIIGASGGYMLSAFFLRQFETIIAVDPEPLAGLIFNWRFRKAGCRIRWIKKDFFMAPGLSSRPLQDFLEQTPGAAILFSNFLGQIPFLIQREADRDRCISFWHSALLCLLSGRSWASFHDRYSGNEKPVSAAAVQSGHQLSGEELIGRFYGSCSGGEWIDHETGAFFPGQGAYDYFLWKLTPCSFHIIEAVQGNNTQECAGNCTG